MPCCGKKEKPVGVDKLKSIITGWKNVIWSDPVVEEIAHLRAAVCAECSLNSTNWCTDCGCWIPAKARSLSEYCIMWEEIDKNI